MLLEVFLYAIHQPPGLNYTFTFVINGVSTTYSINMVITCITMVKIIIIIRTVFRYSSWNNESQILIDPIFEDNHKRQPVAGKTKRNGTKQHRITMRQSELLHFAIKAELKERP